MRTVYPRELNKGFSSKFREGSRLRQESSRVRKVSSQVRQEAPEEGRRSHRPKRCEYNNKDEDNSPNKLDNTNNQASSQKFRKIKNNRILINWRKWVNKKKIKFPTKMSSFFCCFAKDSEEIEEDSDRRNVIQPTAQNGCCCYRFFMSSCTGQRKRKKRYIAQKTPQVCDAAVDTEIDFGIILRDKPESPANNDYFAEGENFDEKMKDHKYASLLFDSKPGKVQYVEGSQVFYVEVRDKKMNQFRRRSFDKSISEDEHDLESDISGEILSDSKSETLRRNRNEYDTRNRKKFPDFSNPGIVYVSSKWSPTTSMDSLTDKKNLSRPHLHNIQEAHENPRNPDNNPLTTSKDGHSIDGGHFVETLIKSDNYDVQNIQSENRAETSSSSSSFQTCIHISPEQPEANCSMQDNEGSEFADISSQSAQGPQSESDLGTGSPIITVSSESTAPKVEPIGIYHENLFTLDCPLRKHLTEDPSGLLLMDRTNSVMTINKADSSVRESTSCPDITVRSDYSSPSPGVSRENSVVTESTNTESGVLSVETQTDLQVEGDFSEMTIPRTPRNSVNSVHTETDFEINENTSKNETENAESDAEDNKSENNHSDSNSESLSSTDIERDSIFGDSDSSSSSGRRRKKKPPLNSSDSTVSSCSSSTHSVRRLDSKPYEHKGKSRRRKSKSSSSSLVVSSSSSSSSSIISSSSSSTTSSSCSMTEGLSLKLYKSNG